MLDTDLGWCIIERVVVPACAIALNIKLSIELENILQTQHTLNTRSTLGQP